MKMKMKLLSAAIGTALGMVSINAQADALLFPRFEAGAGIFSLLSLQAVGDPAGGLVPNTANFGDNTLHYVWNYDDPAQGRCTHFDLFGSMSDFDMIQQTVVDPGVPGGLGLPAIFGDASSPAYLNISPTRGFMTVGDESPEFALWGQMILVNILDGTVAAYKGLNNPLVPGFGNPANPVTDADDFSYIFTSQIFHVMSWYPTSQVDTEWFTIVTGTGMGNPFGWNGARDFISILGGVLDRDEVFLSGVQPLRVVCYDDVELPDFMNSAQLIGTARGGWNLMLNTPVVGNPGTGAMMVKIETTTALGPQRTAVSIENAFPNLPY